LRDDANIYGGASISMK